MEVKLKKGDRFQHRYWCTSDREPLKCLVTRVARGLVYYRPDYGLHEDGTHWLGCPVKFPVEDTGKYVEKML